MDFALTPIRFLHRSIEHTHRRAPDVSACAVTFYKWNDWVIGNLSLSIFDRDFCAAFGNLDVCVSHVGLLAKLMRGIITFAYWIFRVMIVTTKLTVDKIPQRQKVSGIRLEPLLSRLQLLPYNPLFTNKFSFSYLPIGRIRVACHLPT